MGSKEILIAGGGIGGIAAALALARKGLHVRVLEKAPEFSEIGYGIQMGPNGAKMFDRIGVLAALEPHSVYPDALILVDALDNTEITRISLGASYLARYKYRYFAIHRRDLHGELIKACQAHENVVLEASRGLVRFEAHKDGVVVHCENGGAYEGAALIGADGLWSPTRAAVVGDGQARLAGHYVYRGVVPIEDIADTSRANSVTVWCGPRLHLVQYRLRAGTVMNNVATIVSKRFEEGAADAGTPDELDEIFACVHPRVHEMLRYVSRDRNWVLHDRDPVTNWTMGRVTLLGDAAHPTLQYMAQGANMAIEDAVVLADKIAAAGGDHHAAFIAYQGERMNRSARVVLTSRFFGDFVHVGGGARLLRNELGRQRDPDNSWEVDWLCKGI